MGFHLFLILSKDCDKSIVLQSSDKPLSLHSCPSCLAHRSCSSELLYHLLFFPVGRGAHCAVLDSDYSVVLSSCSAVLLLWNSFRPCVTGIPHHLSCHSSILCLETGPCSGGWVTVCVCTGMHAGVLFANLAILIEVWKLLPLHLHTLIL